MKTWKSPFLLLVSVFLVATFFLTGCGLRRGPVTAPESANYKVKANVPYYKGRDFSPSRHILDLYIPKDVKNFPVVVFIHGGAWTVGDKTATANVGRFLAKNGIGVASVNYRLYPKVSYPTFAKDVATAFSWVKKNIRQWGGDPNQMFIGGHSAGGHLAALLSTNDRFLKAHGLSPEKQIRGAILVSGVYRIKKGVFPRIFPAGSAERKEASPYYHVKKNSPPMLILYADRDMPALDEEAEDLYRAIKKANGRARLILVNKRNHGTILGKIGQANDPAGKEILRFISKYRR